jgi:hypothetical protein
MKIHYKFAYNSSEQDIHVPDGVAARIILQALGFHCDDLREPQIEMDGPATDKPSHPSMSL